MAHSCFIMLCLLYVIHNIYVMFLLCCYIMSYHVIYPLKYKFNLFLKDFPLSKNVSLSRKLSSLISQTVSFVHHPGFFHVCFLVFFPYVYRMGFLYAWLNTEKLCFKNNADLFSSISGSTKGKYWDVSYFYFAILNVY